jgi:hypothetical protein
MSADDEARMIQILRTYLGVPYDMRGVLGFISRRDGAQARGRMFCSELILTAARGAGLDLLKRIAPHRVDPGMLSTSPLLDRVGTVVVGEIRFWTMPGNIHISRKIAEDARRGPFRASHAQGAASSGQTVRGPIAEK